MYIDLVNLDPDRYVLVIKYYNPVKDGKIQKADTDVASTTGRTSGRVEFLPCTYRYVCLLEFLQGYGTCALASFR